MPETYEEWERRRRARELAGQYGQLASGALVSGLGEGAKAADRIADYDPSYKLGKMVREGLGFWLEPLGEPPSKPAATEDATLAPPAAIKAPRIPSDFRLQPLKTGVPALDQGPVEVPMRPGGPPPFEEQFDPGTTSTGFVTRGPNGEIMLTNNAAMTPSKTLPKLQGTFNTFDKVEGSSRTKLGGQGGFSPGRAVPPTTATFDQVMATESPAVQDLWLRQVLTSNEIDKHRADIAVPEAQAKLAEAEAGLKSEMTRQMAKDPLQKAYEESALTLQDYVRANPQKYQAGILGTAVEMAIQMHGMDRWRTASPQQRFQWANEVEEQAIAAFAERNDRSIALAMAKAGYPPRGLQ